MTAARKSGFSLLEALIALLILAVGLLGVAGMQAAALYQTHSSTVDGLAAIDAQSLAAEISANTAGLAYYNSTSATSVTSSAQCTNAAAPCTPDQMATYNLSRWGTNLATSLPKGNGQVKCTAVPSQCTITVQWWQQSKGSSSGGTTITYSLLMHP